MADKIQRVEIFLSSPGDVEERDLAAQVVTDINREPEFRDDFSLRLYRWDDKEVVLPMEATETPQKSVNTYMKKPSDCDLVIVMFWSRMGTPLIMDEREYLSGTHYEYKDAVEARHKQGKPSVWLYRCTRKPTLDMTDSDAFKKLEQFRLVEEFFKGFEDDTGRYTGGVNFYEEGDVFADTFGKQLRVFLRKLKDNPQPDKSPEPETQPRYEGKPYPGLEALNDERIFFGRERETLDVLALLDQQRVVFLIGASGSGKSSLAAAGVLPRLGRREGWQVIRFTPGSDPYLSLAKGLVKDLTEIDIAPLERLQKAQDLADQLRQNKTSLADMLDLLTDDKILLFADQFEELFTLTSESDRAAFADLLKHDSSQVRVLATMRADFYENATPYFEKQLRQNFTLSQPSPFALYEMVTEPARLAGLTFDPGLPEQIVTDLGDEPGALALMAYLLEQLYLREQGRGDGVLRQADYDDLGGVQKAIGTHAEYIYQQLPADDDEKDAWMQRVFHELVSVDERGTATRRRVSLARIADDDMPFVDVFAAQTARLLVKGQDTLEVAHEALFRSWDRLVDWIDEAQDDLILLRQVRTAADEWEKRGHPDFLLWPQERLMLVYAMIDRLDPDLSETEKAFIEPESKRLLRELETLPKDATSHERRRDIGDRLAVIGDTRPGVGVVLLPSPSEAVGRGAGGEGLIPDIAWLPVSGSEGAYEFKFGEFVVKPFLIAQYQVTYPQFQAFVEAEDGFNDDRWWAGMPKDYQKQRLRNQRTKIANAPRDSVSWYQSVAFARWMDFKYRELGLFEQFEALTPNPSQPSSPALLPKGEGSKDYREMASQVMVRIARDLRQRQTSAEELLWECLRDRRLNNLKFRRQHPVANTAFVVDFFCHEYKLAVELDGGIHADQQQEDQWRQQALEDAGIIVIRFSNDAVFNDLERVLIDIQRATESPLSLGRGAGGEGALWAEDWQIRLPTEWEWQWAAQGLGLMNGSETREYPWGAWQEGYANTNEAGLSRSVAVGMYPHGVAEWGALDMAGNPWEWCQNDRDEPSVVDGFSNGNRKVLRGGSFNAPRNNAAASYRSYSNPGNVSRIYGLRLVVAAPV